MESEDRDSGQARRALLLSAAIPFVISTGLLLDLLTPLSLIFAFPVAIWLMFLGSGYLALARKVVPKGRFEQTLASKGYIHFYAGRAKVPFDLAKRIIWGLWLIPIGVFLAGLANAAIVTLRG